MGDEEALAKIETLYEQLPTIECQGHCWNSCGPISMSGAERRRISERGVQIQPFTAERSERWAADEPLHCAALDQFHRCTVYEERPFICRAWGTGRGQLACRWGCTVSGPRLRSQEILALQMQAFRIGGPDAGDDHLDEDLGLLEAAMQDPAVAALTTRFIDGERWLRPQMEAAMKAALERLRDQ